MQYREFETKINELGFKFNIDRDGDIIISKDMDKVMIIDGSTPFRMSNVYCYLETQEELFSLGYAFASTPIEKRRDSAPKYHIQMRDEQLNFTDDSYLNVNKSNGYIYLASNVSERQWKTEFTRDEADKIRIKKGITDIGWNEMTKYIRVEE